MNKEEIEEINSNCHSSDQGIFVEPSMIPVHIKEPVIYRRYKSSGWFGGNCWGNKAHFESFEEGEEDFIILDLVLEKLAPKITYEQYKKITKLIHTNEETEYEYYGNSTEWKVEYIILSELENFLNEEI